MIELTVNEIRRLINVLLIRPTRSITRRLRCHAGDVDTKHEPDELITPAGSPSNSHHDHECGCRTRVCWCGG
jgi:hypothetical protein